VVKRAFLISLLVGAASAVQAEDCPLVVNQRFQLRYNQWQVDQGPAVSTTKATYEVETGLPVFTYRLGSLQLNGGVEYTRLGYGAQSDSETGLSHYGARLSLFPYRPIRLYLDYQRSQSPDLLGSGSIAGETWGGGLRYVNRFLGDVRLDYRHGGARLEGGTQGADYRENWSTWNLESHHRFESTRADFQAQREEHSSFGLPAWKLSTASLNTESKIGGNWLLGTHSQIQETDQSRWYNLSITFYGPLSGAWRSYTQLTSGESKWGAQWTANDTVTESIVYDRPIWSGHVTGTYNQLDAKSADDSSRMGTLQVGGAYAFAQDWRLHGDVGLSSLSRTSVIEGANRSTTSYNLGVARGGDVPELLRHSLFFLSDWSYDRRVREEYPPEFVPSELAREMIQRRIRQTGSFGFTADLWRMTDSYTRGSMDWARVSGQVTTRGNLLLNLIGDLRNDDGLALPGAKVRTADVMLNGSYQLGRSSLTASVSLSDTRQGASTQTPQTSGPSVLWTGPDASHRSHTYSAGINTWIQKVPFSVLLMRYDSDVTPATTMLTTWTDMNVGKVAFRLRYSMSRTEGGFRSQSISLDLLRWFDTICFRNWR
jgi:hypothetical protein